MVADSSRVGRRAGRRAESADDLVDDHGIVRPAVLDQRRSASPVVFVSTAAGKDAARGLPGRILVTAGTADMFDLFRPGERFVDTLRDQNIDIAWVPTALDHFGASEARFRPVVRFLLDRLTPPPPAIRR